MTKEQIVVEDIKEAINSLGPCESAAVRELANFFSMNMKRAGSPIGELAIALIGAELAARE